MRCCNVKKRFDVAHWKYSGEPKMAHSASVTVHQLSRGTRAILQISARTCKQHLGAHKGTQRYVYDTLGVKNCLRYCTCIPDRLQPRVTALLLRRSNNPMYQWASHRVCHDSHFGSGLVRESFNSSTEVSQLIGYTTSTLPKPKEPILERQPAGGGEGAFCMP